jgi:hypothetical protein
MIMCVDVNEVCTCARAYHGTSRHIVERLHHIVSRSLGNLVVNLALARFTFGVYFGRIARWSGRANQTNSLPILIFL